MNKSILTLALLLLVACTSQESRVEVFADQIMEQLAAGEYEAVWQETHRAAVQRIEKNNKLAGFRFLALGAAPEGIDFTFNEDMARVSMVRWETLPIASGEQDGKKIYKVQSKPDQASNQSTGVFVFVESEGALKFVGITEKDNSYVRDIR